MSYVAKQMPFVNQGGQPLPVSDLETFGNLATGDLTALLAGPCQQNEVRMGANNGPLLLRHTAIGTTSKGAWRAFAPDLGLCDPMTMANDQSPGIIAQAYQEYRFPRLTFSVLGGSVSDL